MSAAWSHGDTARVERPSGEQLFEELAAAARQRGSSPGRFARRLWPFGVEWKLEQLRMARQPKQQTVNKVRALIAGEPIERDFDGEHEPVLTISRDEREARGLPPSRNEVRERQGAEFQRKLKQEIENRIAIGRLAHDRRLPGETLDDAVARLGLEMAQ